MRCPPDDDLWTVECCEDNPLLGFPETPGWIANDGLPPIVADTTRVMFHDPGHPYRRNLLDRGGYSCAFLAMDVEFLQEVGAHLIRRQPGRSSVNLPRASAPLDRVGFLERAFCSVTFEAAGLTTCCSSTRRPLL
jgi:hypothetical protein